MTADAGDDADLFMHMRDGESFRPLIVNAPEPVEFETETFVGRCLFMHRPTSSYSNQDSGDAYPYKEHFHGRKRLWEWRLQGRFKRQPGLLYAGIELEEYVAVTWGTRALMKGLLPLIQKAIGCKQVHHEIGNEYDISLRPVVVAPLWAFDNHLVHNDPSDAPAINMPTLPTGLGRKAAREYWETIWEGGGPSWDDGGPTFTMSMWGVSPLIDLRAWAFRKLPPFGRNLPMEPFCGRQPVHAVIYELEDGTSDHRQEHKRYAWDVRMVPQYIWSSLSMGPSSPHAARLAAEKFGIDDDTMSFCSALSEGSDPEGMLKRELSRDMDDFNSDEEETNPLTSSKSKRGWSDRQLAQMAERVRVVTNSLKSCRRRRCGRVRCTTSRIFLILAAIVSILFAYSGLYNSLPAVRVTLHWKSSPRGVINADPARVSLESDASR